MNIKRPTSKYIMMKFQKAVKDKNLLPLREKKQWSHTKDWELVYHPITQRQ